MTIEFKINCGNGPQEALITNDGELQIPGYDPSEEEAAELFGEEKTGCYYLDELWNEFVVPHLKKEDEWDDFQKLVRSGEEYWNGQFMDHRWGNVYDILDVFIPLLRQAIGDQDKQAVEIALAINSFQLDRVGDYPDIDYEEVDPYKEDPPGIVTYVEERTLKIGDEDLASWRRGKIRESRDLYNFESDVTDMDEFGGDYNAGATSSVLPAVLKVFGFEEDDTDNIDDPEDFYDKPEEDLTGEGLFGVMYEVIPWREDGERIVEEVSVVVYEDDSDVEKAYELIEDIKKWQDFDDDTIITKVRRLSPSERKKQEAEGVDETIDPLYHEWVELENWNDRPDDFEG